jgi:hypothetical protein
LDGDFIIINNSPIELGHFLAVPRLNEGLHQVVDTQAIEMGIECCLLSGSNNILLGFNSIGAYSSVNHLHVQGYYLHGSNIADESPLPIHRVNKAEKLKSTNHLWFIDDRVDFYMQAFALQLCDFSNDTSKLAR